MKKLKTTIPLAVAAGLLTITASANAATVAVSDATIIDNDYVNADATGAVGRNDGNTRDFRAVMVFSVSDILTNESLVLGDLATTSFTFTFDTNEVIAMTNAGTYNVEYIGFFGNNNGFVDSGAGSGLGSWGGNYSSAATTTVDTGVTDTLADQTGITATGFTLSGVTEADSANDYVLFRINYDEPQNITENQTLTGYTLTAVPEPSSAALIGLGGLALILRRRR
ncbi:MAG: PEP-CTERM sorting domain-containing protein [Verrucomicrobiae bacterium]|nr:PEP-CTERM sorting domain-containing protein [Verrucomicrobiae bacterium]NNJ43868.1 PEP-CTERM sorting domain-containing protein [Akkermansiaceae bacterium]